MKGFYKKFIPLFLCITIIMGNISSIFADGGSFNYSKLYLKDEEDNYQMVTSNVISLINYPTNITIKRTDSDGVTNVAGVGMSVVDGNNEVVASFTTGNESENLTGVLTGGQTYTIIETSHVQGHTPEVSEMEITIENTPDEQIFMIKDAVQNTEPETEEPITEEPTTVKPTDEPTTAPVNEEPTTAEPEADFKITSKTLALSSGISLVFKVNKSLFENRYSEPRVVVLLDGVETEITEYTDEGSKYAFEFTKITPDKMNIMVNATLHATKDGKEYVSPVTEYSVATYAYNMLSKYGETPGMETFRTLLVDLLNYGTASQNYTGFNTDNPANGDLTATQKSWASGDLGELTSVKDNKYVTIDNPSVLWKSAGLALQDAVIVRMKIQADSTDGLVVQVRDDYGTTWNIESEDFAPAAGTENQYYIDFKGFNVGRMSESMYFTVLRNGVAVSNTYRYSVESYVLQYMNYEGPLGELVVAMMKYGRSAQAYSS